MTSNPKSRAPRASGFFLKPLDIITALANISGSLLILALVVLITADVAGRNLPVSYTHLTLPTILRV